MSWVFCVHLWTRERALLFECTNVARVYDHIYYHHIETLNISTWTQCILSCKERDGHASLESVQSLVAKTEHLGHCKSKAGCGYRMSEMLIQSHWHDLRFITLHKCWLRPKSFLRARGCSRWFEHRIWSRLQFGINRLFISYIYFISIHIKYHCI